MASQPCWISELKLYHINVKDHKWQLPTNFFPLVTTASSLLHTWSMTFTIHETLQWHPLGPSWLWSYGSWIYNYLCNHCLSPLMLWVRISIRARCTTLCDKVCQWLATGRWFYPGPPISSTNKTDRDDITEILLKVA